MVKPIVNPLRVAVGPNRILANPKPRGLAPKKPAPKPVLGLLPPPQVLPQQGSPAPGSFLNRTELVDLLWSMMLKTFQILTSSQPELTIFCWLCYYARNPFYEDVGFMSKYNESERDTACIWSQEKNLNHTDHIRTGDLPGKSSLVTSTYL